MLRLITWPIMVVISLALVSFALSNRHAVDLTLFPLPGAITMPLFLLVLVVAFLCMMIGGFVIWCGAAPQRKSARDAEKRATALENDVAKLKAELDKRPPPPVPQAFLMLPNPLVSPAADNNPEMDKADRVA
jgi:uncharacterized integral membrane protein